MKGFLAGLGIGLGLGILFAPMSGEETRSNIRDRANDLADQAKEAMGEGRDRVTRGIQAVRNTAERAASSVRSSTATGTEGV